MHPHRNLLLLAAFAASLLAQPLYAAQPQDGPPEAQLFGPQIRKGQSLESYLKAIERDFQTLNTGGDTLAAADMEMHRKVGAAAVRSMMVTQMFGMDLDDDGFVTRDEMKEMLSFQQRANNLQPSPQLDKLLDRTIGKWMERDKDGDGRVSVTEARTLPDPDTPEGKLLRRQTDRFGNRVKLALLLDADGNGEVTLAEFKAAAEAVFHTVDTDGDAQISQEEAMSFREHPPAVTGETRRLAGESVRVRTEAEAQAEAAERAKEEAICAMPKVSPGADEILAGLYEAQSISNVTIGTQDKTVTTASLVVEPGDTPLYIVVTSYDPVIWRVSGAVERIERLVLGTLATLEDADGKAGTPLVGATGVPADRVTFLLPAKCLPYFTESPSVGAAKAAGIVQAKAGKAPKAIVAEYGMDQLVVPSAKMTSLRGDGAGSNWPLIVTPSGALRIVGEGGSATILPQGNDAESELRRFTPGGVVEIDPKTVVASAPVEPYIVLPEQAGLVQLLNEGALKKNRGGEFLIQKKTRFPAGLYGAHSVTFLLLRGVPMPDGNPGHSTVVSEETGEVLADPFHRK